MRPERLLNLYPARRPRSEAGQRTCSTTGALCAVELAQTSDGPEAGAALRHGRLPVAHARCTDSRLAFDRL